MARRSVLSVLLVLALALSLARAQFYYKQTDNTFGTYDFTMAADVTYNPEDDDYSVGRTIAVALRNALGPKFGIQSPAVSAAAGGFVDASPTPVYVSAATATGDIAGAVTNVYSTP